MKIAGNWNRLSRGLLSKYKVSDVEELKIRKLKIVAKWSIFSRKLVGIHTMTQGDRSEKVAANWKRLIMGIASENQSMAALMFVIDKQELK